jgi:hypothetical protein
VDYLLELEAALLAMKTADDHVSAITRHLKRLNEKPS